MNKIHDVIFNKKINNSSKKKELLKPCLFLDRDGVLIKDCNYIKDEKQVILEVGVFDLINRAIKANWLIVVITNQSGISRGFLSWNNYKNITNKMISLFQKPNPFAAIYANGLGPNADINSWRKPSPEMINQAVRDLPIDINKSILIGDRISDLEAGLNAKIPMLFHVKTGHGKEERKKILKNKQLFEYTKNDPFKKRPTLKLIDNLEAFPLKVIS